jgi:hypothetical protein
MTTHLSLCEHHHLFCFLLVNSACKCRNVVSNNIRFPGLYRNHSLQTLSASRRKPEIAVQNNQLPYKDIQF